MRVKIEEEQHLTNSSKLFAGKIKCHRTSGDSRVNANAGLGCDDYCGRSHGASRHDNARGYGVCGCARENASVHDTNAYRDAREEDFYAQNCHHIQIK